MSIILFSLIYVIISKFRLILLHDTTLIKLIILFSNKFKRYVMSWQILFGDVIFDFWLKIDNLFEYNSQRK